MLHSKRCTTIAKALEFVNDNQNKIIPVSFVSIMSSDEIIVVYEAVEIPEPGTMQFDLLKEAVALFNKLDYFYVEPELEHEIDMLKVKIDLYLSSDKPRKDLMKNTWEELDEIVLNSDLPNPLEKLLLKISKDLKSC